MVCSESRAVKQAVEASEVPGMYGILTKKLNELFCGLEEGDDVNFFCLTDWNVCKVPLYCFKVVWHVGKISRGFSVDGSGGREKELREPPHAA